MEVNGLGASVRLIKCEVHSRVAVPKSLIVSTDDKLTLRGKKVILTVYAFDYYTGWFTNKS